MTRFDVLAIISVELLLIWMIGVSNVIKLLIAIPALAFFACVLYVLVMSAPWCCSN